MKQTETWWGILSDDGKLVFLSNAGMVSVSWYKMTFQDEGSAVKRARDMTRHGHNVRVVEGTLTYDDWEEESDG